MSAKFKKLRLQYEYLSLEKDEIKEVCEQMGKEMNEFFSLNYPKEYKIFSQHNLNNAATKNSEISSCENNPIKKPKEMKRLYRQIAVKIHPDKKETGNTILFKSAAEAYKDNNISKLIEIANLIDLPIPAFSAESIYILETKIKDLGEHIKDLRNTSAWRWSHLKDEEEKNNLIRTLMSITS
jgi:hypothetical protein|tara:strand:+ start:283 stop:828 length:546 start_codon:yes stop_codon:yes gene_type:complete